VELSATKDNSGVEYYCTIFTVDESPVQKGVIWTGSDDGLVHVFARRRQEVEQRHSERHAGLDPARPRCREEDEDSRVSREATRVPAEVGMNASCGIFATLTRLAFDQNIPAVVLE